MNINDEASPELDPLASLAGGGEMGVRTRSFDWSRTPLGPIEAWPQSLRSALSICLNSSFPIALYWGGDLVLLYNDDWSAIPGEKHPWALGRPAREAWSEIWDIIGPLFEHVVTTGEATRRRDQLLPMRRHGFTEECYFDYTFSPIRGEGGKVDGVFNAVIETTTRVIGERRQRTLRELAAWKAGEAGSAEDACKTAAEILGGNPLDLPFALLYLLDDDGRRARLAGQAGLDPGTLACPATVDLGDRDAPWPFRRVSETGAGVVLTELTERFGPLPGGGWPESPQRALVLPMARPGHEQLAGFVVAGISPRLALNDEYKGFMDLLAGHVAALVANARAYEQERRRAEELAELDRAKTAFFSNVSHEFRTPLALMLGPVEDMLARPEGGVPSEDRELLEVVYRNAHRLLRLVNTLLDFSRIEAGRVQAGYEPTDLAALTADLASNFRSACERAGLRLEVDCAPLGEPAYVDRAMWEKVVLNLLSNAFKFTFEGEIEVSLRQAGGAAELRVRDTGTGVPPGEMPRLFERFHRVQGARGRTHEGSGIGLALVQELVRLHGGSIAAESVLGRGTTFLVTIPLGSVHLPTDRLGTGRTQASMATGAAPYVEEALRWLPGVGHGGGDGPSESPIGDETLVSPDGGQARGEGDDRPLVLVADDNADMRRYVARLLAGRYRIEAVPDGEAALEAARRRAPDLILTDVMMPGLDGFGLLRQLRADPRTRSLPIILLSARAGEESRVEGMEAGADDYLVKPFGARELQVRVAAQLQMARLRREAGESLRRGEERLRLALTTARMVAWEFAPESGCIDVLENAADVFGLPPGTQIREGDQAFALLHPEDVGRHRATVAGAVESGGSYLTQFRMVRPDDGRVIWMEERGHAVRDEAGRTLRLVGVVQDITERKRAEDALKEADRRKDEFLATLAHELRNPLAPIRTALRLMAQPDGAGRGHEDERAMAERQVVHLARLIDDLMDVARISRGKLELHKQVVDLHTVVRQAVETARTQIDDRRHRLTLSLPEGPIRLEADPTRLEQVFWNLLNNAAKYTEPGGRIDLTAEVEDGQVAVRVRDTGVGVGPEMLPRLFQMFVQVGEHKVYAQGGLGIGLGLVRTLVEMHGGSITAHSEGPGRGSEFVVRLPVLDAGSPEPTPSGPDRGRDAGTALPRRRILVVDDNVDAAVSLARLLSRLYGQDVRVAHDGPEALRVAEEIGPDVVLLDIGMPGMDGHEVARRLRGRPEFGAPLIVALTGWGQDSDRRKSGEAGFDHHLVKPVDSEDLRALLARPTGTDR